MHGTMYVEGHGEKHMYLKCMRDHSYGRFCYFIHAGLGGLIGLIRLITVIGLITD